MEFPDLGKHCTEKSCNKLDFLPMKCDACSNIFCSEHFSYSKHSCPSANQKDYQIPVCPLCGEPIPTPKGVSPDQTVGEHMDQYCKLEKKKIFTNACCYKNCKKKELIPFNCSQCHQNYCLKHRHTADHECKPQSAAGVAAERRSRPNGLNLSGTGAKKQSIQNYSNNFNGTNNNALGNRSGSNSNFNTRGHTLAENIQGNMTEEEALAHAMALSIMELDESADREHRRNQEQSSVPVVAVTTTKDKCRLS